MKKTSITFLFAILIGALKAHSQFFVTSGTAMLHVPDWDRVVRYHNLATTWQSDDLPPLQWGYQGGMGYTFLVFRKPQIFAAPQLRYTHWNSHNDAIKLIVHQLSIGPEIRFNPRALFFGVESAGPLGPRWYIGLQPGLQCWMPMIARHDAWTRYDEETTYRPLTFRFDFKISTGFHSIALGSFVLTPELSVQWVKGTELYDWTEQILGHNILNLNNKASRGWSFGAGLIITKIKKSENWWDRPRS
jgi:hypothetical protein